MTTTGFGLEIIGQVGERAGRRGQQLRAGWAVDENIRVGDRDILVVTVLVYNVVFALLQVDIVVDSALKPSVLAIPVNPQAAADERLWRLDPVTGADSTKPGFLVRFTGRRKARIQSGSVDPPLGASESESDM